MKKLSVLFFALICMLGFSACTPTQEMHQGASFDGLTKYYIMPVTGGDYFFKQYYGSRQEYDQMLYDAIKEVMASRGFENVATPEEAQFALRPIYSEWNYNDDNLKDITLEMSEAIPLSQTRGLLYLNLEIEAYLPHIEKWAWRGFSYIKLSRSNMSVAAIKDQAKWCLLHFPPERFPSQTQMNAAEEANSQASSETK